MDFGEVIRRLLEVIGLITIMYLLFRSLAKLIDSIDFFYKKVKVKIYYPIISRFSKREHKKYIETYFNDLLFRKPIERPLSFGKIKVEWSDEESVSIDLERNVLLVRVKYAEELERILAKTALLAAPYLISEHLESALGKDFSRLISIGIIESYLQEYPNVLNEFRKLAEELYGRSPKYRGILALISRIDDTSLYQHIVLYELRKILESFGSKVDRNVLVGELEDLLSVTASLEEISAPKVCGYYVNIVIVRVGKLEKVALGLWEGYVEFIKRVRRECENLQRVYIVSAGKYTTKVVERLIEYLGTKIQGLTLLDKFQYKARYYKGMINIPHLVVIMELK